ncbi:MAG: M48 family metalloprotease [Haliea sp.]|nr:M48 family metalloprotease [Haliea sp.]
MVLLLGAALSRAAPQELYPSIAPGYVPSAASDEVGLWTELEDYERAIRRSALRVRDPGLNAYVQKVLCRVSGEYCQDLRLYLIRNPHFNASMTANGIVQVWTGLLMRVSSEDELAAVLGHELAHYTQLHSLEQIRRATAAMTTGSIFDMSLLILTGVNLPAGQMTAIASVMSFSRADESEADLLGTRFMVEGGYDPRAAARVWDTIVAEEKRAVAKREEPGIFSKTHPSSDERVEDLREYVAAHYPDVSEDPEGRERHVKVLSQHYGFLMEDQIDTNRYGRTEDMLERHRKLGVDDSLIEFYYGEMYRQRDGEGDREKALKSYLLAGKANPPVAEAYLQLGYMYMKLGDAAAARASFETYLLLEPESDERAMIEFYLEDL